MKMRAASLIPVEVDMVPLIDIVSLLLMFLVMVGDMARSASNVKMRLPRADQAGKEVPYEGRMVVQLKKNTDGRYSAVVENHEYELVQEGRSKTLITYLEEQIARRRVPEAAGSQAEIAYPVKLRIPADAPMFEVERMVMTLARAKLVNIEYAAEKVKD